MDKVYSSTALKERQGEVKAAAREGLVRITENGSGAFVFCSDEVFQREIDDAVERALYAARVGEAVLRGRVAAREGRVVEGIEAARAEVAKRRNARV